MGKKFLSFLNLSCSFFNLEFFSECPKKPCTKSRILCLDKNGEGEARIYSRCCSAFSDRLCGSAAALWSAVFPLWSTFGWWDEPHGWSHQHSLRSRRRCLGLGTIAPELKRAFDAFSSGQPSRCVHFINIYHLQTGFLVFKGNFWQRVCCQW